MINTIPKTSDLDLVIHTFLEEFPIPIVPSMDDVQRWRERFPHFGTELFELAEGLFELSLIRGEDPIPEQSEAELEQSLMEMTYRVTRTSHRLGIPFEQPYVMFGARAKQARETQGMSTSEVAAQLRLTVQQLNAIENEDQPPRTNLLKNLAAVLKVPMTYLLGNTPFGN